MKIIILFIILICQEITATKLKEKPINIKIVPAKMNELSIDDLDDIKSQVLNDVNIK
jgi:hypothetical protein